MPIVSSEIVEDSLQANNRRALRERHVDHLGNEYIRSSKIDASVDVNLKLAEGATFIQNDLENSETQKYLDMASSGIEIDPTTNPDYVSKANLLRALIRQAFLEAGHITAFSIIAIIDSLTDTQIKNAVGIDQAKVNKIRNRVTNLKLIRTAIENDAVDIEEVGE